MKTSKLKTRARPRRGGGAHARARRPRRHALVARRGVARSREGARSGVSAARASRRVGRRARLPIETQQRVVAATAPRGVPAATRPPWRSRWKRGARRRAAHSRDAASPLFPIPPGVPSRPAPAPSADPLPPRPHVDPLPHPRGDRWEFCAPHFHDFEAGDDVDHDVDAWFESAATKGLATPVALQSKPTSNRLARRAAEEAAAERARAEKENARAGAASAAGADAKGAFNDPVKPAKETETRERQVHQKASNPFADVIEGATPESDARPRANTPKTARTAPRKQTPGERTRATPAKSPTVPFAESTAKYSATKSAVKSATKSSAVKSATKSAVKSATKSSAVKSATKSAVKSATKSSAVKSATKSAVTTPISARDVEMAEAEEAEAEEEVMTEARPAVLALTPARPDPRCAVKSTSKSASKSAVKSA